MAPRGRSRKPRLMRMDAAVDHMGLYGFPEELVRRSVKKLLKEYGGDDGWPFIEENGYMVLLDDMLKEQDERVAGENSNEEENLLLDMAPADEIAGDNSVADDGGPLSLVRLPICSGVTDDAMQIMETGGGGQGRTDIALDQNCNDNDMVGASGKCEEESTQIMELDNTPVQSSPSVVPSTTPSNDLPRRRKPCFGWISSDDKEDDFIKLIPAKPAPRPENRNSGMVKKSKRKTRWDEGPSDM
ncbi:uncharacterized protein LOC130764772 isoform X2 [Actinidia eriantha]|uniref:uncharacterized protein LOC130764772 isoform X2 n=1 Tax=Actinidia eriantha TaxID=165200 RepID=UPI00258B9B76|nr:uncharacterized protein LOC130764772 isoform X2 [Actinidia eriantha]